MLYLTSTPIGNLKDITLRALEVLKGVDYIVCEDTRRTRILLSHYRIEKPLLSYYEKNRKQRLPKILKLLREGKDVALLSSAGLPCIQDPGFLIVRACLREGLKLTVIPGAESVLSSLSISGLPSKGFFFYGFLPRTRIKRINTLKRLLNNFQNYTLIFFESPYRILKLLEDLRESFPSRYICIVRELTKVYEEVLRGLASELYHNLSQRVSIKGEFVVLIAPQGYRP